MTLRPSETTLSRLAAVVGVKHAIRDAAEMDGYMREWREIWHGKSPMVLRPGTTEEVSRILAIADETLTAIVPQSGNTGLVGGQLPHETGTEVVLSLDRMTRIVDANPSDNTMMVEAGATLKSVQDAAAAVDRLFPLSLASEGSCRIGGNLSTNAGGLNVMAYGTARDQCLGLEVVLAGGRVWNGLRRLRKDNTGYDLKNMFIGAEGTLGVITGAVLKLYPRPKTYETAFIAVTSPQAAVDLLSLARDMSGNRVVAFELIPRIAMGFTVKHMGVRNPLSGPSPWYVLSELADPSEGSFLRILEEAVTRGLATNATVAQSGAQRDELWAIRELMPESQKFEGGSIKHDIAVPVSKVPQFLEVANAAVLNFMAEARVMAYGHLGDGNIHYNVTQPIGVDKKAFLDCWDDMNAVVFEIVTKFGGSISAEHGIGRLKRHHMTEIKSEVELGMMRDLKRMLDPHGILNPGKVLPVMSFRAIADKDVEAVIALWRDCGLTRPWNDPYKDIAFARRGADSTIIVGEIDGRIVSSVMVGHDGHRGMLYYLAVAPDLQGKGLGKEAVRAAETWLGERGVWKINLLVRAENGKVRGFYEKLGYEINPVMCMARRIAN